ncbi:MAG: hypothetical protein Aurels2KO_43180 [Aureliella sp.]
MRKRNAAFLNPYGTGTVPDTKLADGTRSVPTTMNLTTHREVSGYAGYDDKWKGGEGLLIGNRRFCEP